MQYSVAHFSMKHEGQWYYDFNFQSEKIVIIYHINRSAVKLLCNYSVTKLYLIYLYSEVQLELAIRASTWLNTYLHQSQYM